MSHFNLPEPPTKTSLAEARTVLDLHRQSIDELNVKINTAEAELARIVEESRSAIHELESQKAVFEEKIALTLAYVSPIRRLPHDLLRHIFLLNFEEYPCCAWVLSAVSPLWRRLVLSMPTMWSKIRLVTTPTTSADTIRLWLERSGSTVPLDIEIFLRSQPLNASVPESSSRRRVSSLNSQMLADWMLPQAPLTHTGIGGTATYVQVPPTPGFHIFPLHPAGGGGGGGLLVTNTQHVVPPLTGHAHDDLWGMPPVVSSAGERSGLVLTKSKKSMHWGHIAFFYLMEQMHRWERFIFRFDKMFSTISPLKNMEGDAPMLREFEVSCGDSSYFGEWKWFPCSSGNLTYDMPSLRKVTLHYVPFKWSSSMFRNLHTLTLRTLPTVHLALDRIMHIISSSPQLKTLSLHFASPTPPVLPLTPTTLPVLKNLAMSGHYLLSSLIDALILPTLDSLILDIDAREPIEDMVSALVARSNNPPVTHLALSYGLGPGAASAHTFYYGGAGVGSWHFLSELDNLRTLQIGNASLEPLVCMLAGPDDEGHQEHWVCPNLTALAMRQCHSHGDGVGKLVQMVDARNPDPSAPHTGTGAGPARLKCLELYDCTTLGPDVLKWLKERVDEVVCTEPAFESPRSPSFAFT